MRAVAMNEEVLVGDVVKAMGYEFTVGEILSQHDYGQGEKDVEFKDNKGRYHHWQQWNDKGEVYTNRQ